MSTKTLDQASAPIDTHSEISWTNMLEQALTAPGQMGNTYNRFYRYSFGNQLLLWMQGIDEPVNTYDRWKKMGRLPQKGLTKYTIMVPILIKDKENIDPVTGQPKIKFMKFKYVRALIKLSDTIGDDLPEPTIPNWDLNKALEALDIKQEPFKMTDGNVQGYSFERTVTVNPVAVYPMKTRLHEIAHVLLGHTTREDYAEHRGECEFQAEAVAYLLMHELGMDEHMNAAESRAYIQNWLKGETPSAAACRQVFSTVEKILKAGQ